MARERIGGPITHLSGGTTGRRGLMRRVGALGVSEPLIGRTLLTAPAGAQDATSNASPGASPMPGGGTAGSTAVTIGLLIRMEAKPGQEEAVADFLRDGLVLVEAELATTAWFGIRLGLSTFGIFDVFPDDAGRQVHLAGRVAAGLQERGGATPREGSPPCRP